MKALIAFLPLILVSVAHADHYPLPQPKLVAEARTAGGMMGPNPNFCMSTEVRLYSDGTVVTTKCEKDPQTVLILPTPRVAIVQNLVAQLGPVGKLVEANPEQPMCADAPSTTFTVQKGEVRIEVGGVFNCKQMVVESDPSGASYRLSEIVQNIESLAGNLRK